MNTTHTTEPWHKRVTFPGVELYLGDCIELLATLKADAIITDPPYGMGYNSKGRIGRPGSVKSAGGVYGREWGDIEGDDRPFDPLPLLQYGKPLVTWGANHYASRLPDVAGWLVWDKSRGGTISKGFTWSHCEMAWCSETGDCTRIFDHLWNGFRRQTEVGEHHHPTQKPVALMAWCMEQAKVPEGATVLDPYMGSGSTIIAAIRTGRKAIGIEKDPKHFKTACERIKRELAQGDLFLGQNNIYSYDRPADDQGPET
jgi:site-specific DNA-methyltransferase (adenine-specific)